MNVIGFLSGQVPTNDMLGRFAYLDKLPLDVVASLTSSNLAFTGSVSVPTVSLTDTTQAAVNAQALAARLNAAITLPMTDNTVAAVPATTSVYGTIVLSGNLTSGNTLLFSGAGVWNIINTATAAAGTNVGTLIGAGTTTTLGLTLTIPAGGSARIYSNGTDIRAIGATADQAFTTYSFTATANQTVFPMNYTPPLVFGVYGGAFLQVGTDFTATTGTSITMNTPLNAGEKLVFYAFTSFTVANAMTLSGGTMLGALNLAAGSTAVTPAVGDSSQAVATTAGVMNQLIQGRSTVGGVINQNLLPNGSGELVMYNWTASSATAFTVGTDLHGTYFTNNGTFASGVTRGITSGLVAVGVTLYDYVTLSGYIDTTGITGDNCWMELAPYYLAGTSAGTAVKTNLVPAGSGMTYVSATLSLPQYTQKLRVNLVVGSGGAAAAVTAVKFRNIKVEPGSYSTLYSADASIAHLGAGALNIQVFSTAGTATYTPTVGTRSYAVWGSGGGGASGTLGAISSGYVAAASSGAPGAAAFAFYNTPPVSTAITIGAGGAVNTGSAANTGYTGGSGGTTSFGSLLTIPGGSGGTAAVSNSTSGAAVGATPATTPTGSGIITSIYGVTPGYNTVSNNATPSGAVQLPGLIPMSRAGLGGLGSLLASSGSYAGAVGLPGIIIVFEYP